MGIQKEIETTIASKGDTHAILMRIKDMLDREKFAPNRVQGTVPLCMWQYSRTFGMVRVPGTEEDELVQYTQSRHIVVICNNQYFKLNMYYDEKSGKYLSRLDIQLQIERILDAAEKGKPDPYVAALTSQGRTEWAEHRQKSDPKQQLHHISRRLYGLHRPAPIWLSKHGSNIGYSMYP